MANSEAIGNKNPHRMLADQKPDSKPATLSLPNVFTQIHLELHYLKTELKKNIGDTQEAGGLILKDIQEAQDCLKRAKSKLHESLIQVEIEPENLEAVKNSAHEPTHRTQDSTSMSSAELRRHDEELQQHADLAIRYKSMYMQLLDKLEECGVHVSIDDEETNAERNEDSDESSDTEEKIDGPETPLSTEMKNYEVTPIESNSVKMAPVSHSRSRSESDYVSSDDQSNEDSIGSVKDEDICTEEDIAAVQMSHSLKQAQAELPTLEGFLEKKSPTFGRGWQKRFVVVKDYNIFYGREKVRMTSDADVMASKKFLNCVSLLVVQGVHEKTDRNGTKTNRFEITARDPRTGDMRHYLWRARTVDERDKWVEGLNQHKDLLHSMMQWAALNQNDTGVEVQIGPGTTINS